MDWFRMYDEIIDDPKVLSLTPTDRWHYVALLSASNRQQVRGTLPKLQAIATHLRLAQPKVVKLIERLVEAELVDRTEVGFVIHGWDKRQRKSDNVAERVAVWRENHPVTLQKRDRNVPRVCVTETETETESPLPPETGGCECEEVEPFQSEAMPPPPEDLPADKLRVLNRQTKRFGASNGDRTFRDLLQDHSAAVVDAAGDFHFADANGQLWPKRLAGICREMTAGRWQTPDKSKGRFNSKHDPGPTNQPPPNVGFATPEAKALHEETVAKYRRLTDGSRRLPAV